MAGVVLGLTAEWVRFGWGDPRHWILDLAVGWTFIGCGLVAWARRPKSHTGPLMAATGFTWFLELRQRRGGGAGLGGAVYLHRGPLVQLVLAYPSGRPGSRHPRSRRGRLRRGGRHDLAERGRHHPAGRAAGGCLRTRVCSAVGGARRARLIALQAAAGLSLVLAGTAAARLLLPPEQVSGPSLLVYEVALCVLAGGLLAGLLVAPWQRAAVADLVVELGEVRSDTVRGAVPGAWRPVA